MINPLLIARKENAGILRKICSELGAEAREMSGDDWSLEPNPFVIANYEEIFDREFAEWADVESSPEK